MGADSPNIVLLPLARAMFCRASSCRICIAAGEAKIYDTLVFVALEKWRKITYIGGLPHELGSIDLGSGSNDLRFTDSLLRSGRRERLLQLDREVDVLEQDRLDGDTPLFGSRLDLTCVSLIEMIRRRGMESNVGLTISATSWARPSRSEMTDWRTRPPTTCRRVVSAFCQTSSTILKTH